MVSSTLVDLLDPAVRLDVALENTAGVLPPAVASQAAGRQELANLVDRRHQMADRLCRFGVAIEERVGAYWERAAALLGMW